MPARCRVSCQPQRNIYDIPNARTLDAVAVPPDSLLQPLGHKGPRQHARAYCPRAILACRNSRGFRRGAEKVMNVRVALKRIGLVYALNALFKAAKMKRALARLSVRYSSLCKGLEYKAEDIPDMVAERLKERGIFQSPR